MDCAVSRTGFIYMGQDNTDLHENLTDIPAKGSFVEAILRMRF